MERWASWIARTTWAWIIIWPVAAISVWHGAPRIPTLLRDDSHGFLPSDIPSQRAFAHLRDDFPEHAPASRAVVVFVRLTGLTDADRAFMGHVASALAASNANWNWRVRSASLAPHLKPLLESPNGKAGLIVVELPADMLTHSTVNRVRQVQATVAAQEPRPAGLVVEITGSGALGELLDAQAKRDIEHTTRWTFLAVSLILLFIYRSPVAMLLPIVTAMFSLMVALGLLGRAAAAGWPINGLVEMFIVVILVGAGVDYCLFLFARFREELHRGSEVEGFGMESTQRQQGNKAAVTRAMSRTGSAILGSTATNAVGLATLALARNRDLYTSGPTIAFALCVATFAVFTLAPSLMHVVGPWLLWPTTLSAGRVRESALWSSVARLATGRPVAVSAVAFGALVPLAVVAIRVQPVYDSLAEFPPESSFVRGARLYEEHFFSAGSVSEVTVLISGGSGWDGEEALSTMSSSIDEAARVRTLFDTGPTIMLRNGLEEVARVVHRRFPVAYWRDLRDPLGEGPVRSRPMTLADLVAVPFTHRLAREYYVGQSGTTTRIDVGLRVPPRSTQGMDIADRLRATVQETLDQSEWVRILGTPLRVDLAGETPRYADIRALRSRDFRVIAVSATILIFLILILLTRSAAYSCILLGATFLTYLATYAATWLIVTTWYGVDSVSYQLDFLLFVILMSLGQDYNIYVVTRIREEMRRATAAEAIATAVRKTGPVVSSCGVIMAAAFASMFSGSLLLMKQFAIALSLGILIDTFVVRPLLVPALILLVARRKRGPVPVQGMVVANRVPTGE